MLMSTQYVQYVLLFLVLAVNSDQFQILWVMHSVSVTHSYSSRPFLCALVGSYSPTCSQWRRWSSSSDLSVCVHVIVSPRSPGPWTPSSWIHWWRYTMRSFTSWCRWSGPSGALRSSESEVCERREGKKGRREREKGRSQMTQGLRSWWSLMMDVCVKQLSLSSSPSLHGGSPPSQNSLQASPAIPAASKTAPFCKQSQQLPHDQGEYTTIASVTWSGASLQLWIRHSHEDRH